MFSNSPLYSIPREACTLKDYADQPVTFQIMDNSKTREVRKWQDGDKFTQGSHPTPELHTWVCRRMPPFSDWLRPWQAPELSVPQFPPINNRGDHGASSPKLVWELNEFTQANAQNREGHTAKCLQVSAAAITANVTVTVLPLPHSSCFSSNSQLQQRSCGGGGAGRQGGTPS